MQDTPSKSPKRRRGKSAASVKQPKSVRPEAPSLKPASSRAERAAERREAIIDAALDEFIARGFAATRLDDVAKRAGVAKGTIYLHFKDKESMFEELIRTAMVPLIGRLAATPPAGGSVRAALEGFAQTFMQEVVTTRRGDIVRLIVAEGARFPSVADFYYREVVARGLAGMRALIELGIARGEIQQQGLARFPQIVVAPGDDRRDLARPVRQACATRRGRDAARPSRSDFWRTEDDMTSSRMIVRILAALALALAGCSDSRNPGYQGWVEADMIFVSPDESGRVTKLNVREGDEVKTGEALYSVDDDLQQADLNQSNATLANAQQSYDRAASLSKTGSGTQATLDAAVVGAARRRSAGQHLADPAGAAHRLCAGQRHHPADLLPRGRNGAGAAAGAVDHAARQHEDALLRAGAGIAEACDRRRGTVTCDNCAADLTAKIYFIATSAEYTPPVIYSLDERNKLVYLIQARPSRPDCLARRPADQRVSQRQDADGGQAMTAAPASDVRHRHRRPRPVEVVRRPRGGA